MLNPLHFRLVLGALALTAVLAGPTSASTPAEAGAFTREQAIPITVGKTPPMHLTALPGESVEQIASVPITYQLPDGTQRVVMETVTFRLRNTVIAAPNGVNAPNTVWLGCAADMNNSHGLYTRQIDWHYDMTNAWVDSSWATRFVGLSPYTQGNHDTTPRPPTGGLPSWRITTYGEFIWDNSPYWVFRESHDLYFDLYANGTCTALGGIF